jgi:hypothetical protein
VWSSSDGPGLGHDVPGDDRVKANWANATLAAWFGAQNCYLDMAAMRRDPT